MAEFCVKCFSTLDENGVCPLCGAATHTTPVEERVPEVEIVPEVEEIVPEVEEAAPEVEEIVPEVEEAAPEVEIVPEVEEVVPEAEIAPEEDAFPDIPDVPEKPIWLEPTVAVKPAPKFCMKCGGSLDENGLCPVCDAPPAPPAIKFCMKCGGSLDANGRCPVCEPMASLSAVATQTAVVVAEEVPQTEPKKSGAWKVVLSVVLSILLFITLLGSVSVLTARNTVSKGGVATLTKELDVAQLLESTGGANNDQINEFYHRMEREYNIQMDNDKLTELVQSSTIPTYIAEKTDAFTNDYFKGEAELVVTREEMIDLIYENLDLLEAQIPEGTEYNKLSKDDCEVIAKWLLKEDEYTILSSDKMQETTPAVYQLSTIGLSYVSLAVFLLLSALIAFFMCWNSLSQAAVGGGVVCILLGGLTSFAAAVVAWIPSLWTSLVGSNLALSIVGAVLVTNAWIFVTLLVLGVALLITRTICKYVKKA